MPPHAWMASSSACSTVVAPGSSGALDILHRYARSNATLRLASGFDGPRQRRVGALRVAPSQQAPPSRQRRLRKLIDAAAASGVGERRVRHRRAARGRARRLWRPFSSRPRRASSSRTRTTRVRAVVEAAACGGLVRAAIQYERAPQLPQLPHRHSPLHLPSTYIRSLRPQFFAQKRPGLLGLVYKGSVIGTRLSPWVSGACLILAGATLFF